MVEAFYRVAINSISPSGGPDTPGIAAAFCSGLAQTPAIPQSSISAAFAASISHDIEFFTERHTHSYGGGLTLGVSLLIANSCGQDAAIRSGLLQVTCPVCWSYSTSRRANQNAAKCLKKLLICFGLSAFDVALIFPSCHMQTTDITCIAMYIFLTKHAEWCRRKPLAWA